MTLNGKKQKIYRAIGLMTGTSMDGIDVAAIESDGAGVITGIGGVACELSQELGRRLGEVASAARRGQIAQGARTSLDTELTDQHARAVEALIRDLRMHAADFDVVGFHGQTVFHNPDQGWTWQIGDGQRLADRLGLTVVDDFRSADMKSGGQGAPLAPVYHLARLQAAHISGPVCVLNLGGIANITWIGQSMDAAELIAFDTGPGNALIDDWIRTHTAQSHDAGGAIAARGVVDEGVLRRFLRHPFFSKSPPKSLDRNDFSIDSLRTLSLEDGAATLAAFTVEAIRRGLSRLPKMPARLLVAGGGRHNQTLMKMLKLRLGLPVEPVEAVGWNGDLLEAEAFAYMAIRRLRDLPISFPGTTGVIEPKVGGLIHQPQAQV